MTLRPAHISWILCTIALVVFFGAFFIVRPHPPHEPVPTAVAGHVRAEFTLTDHLGKSVTAASWPGKYMLVYFGFTHCPDVCPLGLNKMAEALDTLDTAQRVLVQPVFITVDPERDDVAALAEYVPLFMPDLVGLTGTAAQIDSAKKSFRVYAQREGDGPDYMVNHSAFTYLMGPDGSLAHVFSHDTTAPDMGAFLAKYLK